MMNDDAFTRLIDSSLVSHTKYWIRDENFDKLSWPYDRLDKEYEDVLSLILEGY